MTTRGFPPMDKSQKLLPNEKSEQREKSQLLTGLRPALQELTHHSTTGRPGAGAAGPT